MQEPEITRSDYSRFFRNNFHSKKLTLVVTKKELKSSCPSPRRPKTTRTRSATTTLEKLVLKNVQWIVVVIIIIIIISQLLLLIITKGYGVRATTIEGFKKHFNWPFRSCVENWDKFQIKNIFQFFCYTVQSVMHLILGKN